mgnify:CR=1 FL=1
MQPGQQKITQFDEVNSTQSGDIIPIVRGGQNKRISVENFTGVLPEGWLSPAEEWTFASFGNGVGVITIPEGNINRYPNGTRVWFKQGTPTATDRYGVVIASTTTSITIAMVNSTTLQNLAIQQPAISGETAPRTPQNVDFTTQLVADEYRASVPAPGEFNVATRTTFDVSRLPVGATFTVSMSLDGGSSTMGNLRSRFLYNSIQYEARQFGQYHVGATITQSLKKVAGQNSVTIQTGGSLTGTLAASITS